MGERNFLAFFIFVVLAQKRNKIEKKRFCSYMKKDYLSDEVGVDPDEVRNTSNVTANTSLAQYFQNYKTRVCFLLLLLLVKKVTKIWISFFFFFDFF